MWLPVFYLSRSYSGIKNFTLRFYKILEDASKTLFRHVSWLVFIKNLDSDSDILLVIDLHLKLTWEQKVLYLF